MRKQKSIILAGICLLITAFLFGISLKDTYLPSIEVGINTNKEIHEALRTFHGSIVETRWSAFGQTDLVGYRNNHDRMDMYIDGTAGTPMYRFNGNFTELTDELESLKRSFTGYFPFLFLHSDQKDNALIIGPGGGRDILLAKMGNVREIKAVEVNKDFVNVVREYSSFNGGIYEPGKGIDIVVDEGRNYLKRQDTQYDIIMMSLPATNTSRSREGYAMTENFLLTTEAVEDYFNHLTPEGRLVIVTHGDVEALRILSVSLAYFNKKEIPVDKAMKHMYLLGDIDYPLFVLKKKPFEFSEIVLRYEKAKQMGYDISSSFFPFCYQFKGCNQALLKLEQGQQSVNELVSKVKLLGYDIDPVTDNSPFFFKFEKGVPQSVLIVFYCSAAFVIFMVMIPLFIGMQRKEIKAPSPMKGMLKYGLVFALLGAGFMVVEISLIQRFVLFLGRPVLSMATLLFSLLIGAGIGSLMSGRFITPGIARGISRSALMAAVFLLCYTGTLPLVFKHLMGLDLVLRIFVSVMLVTALGFFMGFPFPLAIRVIEEQGMKKNIPWAWGINGISSVLGSALTVIIAIKCGFNEALIIGAGCYFVVFLICRTKRFDKEFI